MAGVAASWLLSVCAFDDHHVSKSLEDDAVASKALAKELKLQPMTSASTENFVVTDNLQYQGGSSVPMLDSCCCILPLRTGVKLIAFGELILGSVLLIYTITVTTNKEFWSRMNIGEVIETPETRKEFLYLHYTTLLDMIFAIYLLIGIYKNRPHYAKLWCVVETVHLFVSCSVTIYDSVVLPSTKEMGAKFFGHCLGIGLDMYVLLVVYSYYRSTKEYCRNVCPAV